MKGLLKTIACLLVFISAGTETSFAATTLNQTDDLSQIQPASGLPFRVQIEKASFQLPVGIHSGVVGVYNGFWIFIAGRINGLHGFGADPFPPDTQNKSIYVVNSRSGRVFSRALSASGSGLSQVQIDTLSVTSPQGYQQGKTLFMTGGYGYDTGTGTYGTKDVLTAINLPGVLRWVREPNNQNLSLARHIRQISNSIFQVTGGTMAKVGNYTQLVFGQSFTGVYTTSSNGDYIQQVRRFRIINGPRRLSVKVDSSLPHSPDGNYRRRDLNIVPFLKRPNNSRLQSGLVAYAGVFTTAGGVWTVPVVINENGDSSMANPNLPTSFKQGMNQYVCATANLYSNKYSSSYNILFGGITYGYYTNGVFQTDSEIPFTNEVTTIKMDKNGIFTQYLMNNQYPTILSTSSNPGNTLLFGAGAYFITTRADQYYNGMIKLDNINGPTVIGYIVGGIQSTLPNTNTDSDSAASPYVFKVTLIPTRATKSA